MAALPPDRIKRVLAFHPPLLALHAPLALYAANVSLVPIIEVLVPSLLIVGGSLALWGLLTALFRESARAAIVASILILTTLHYRLILDALTASLKWADLLAFSLNLPLYLLLIGLVVTCAGAYRLRRSLASATLFLNVAAVCMLGLAATSAAISHVGIARELKRLGSKLQSRPGQSKDRPDVFYIVLDGYGRTDTFERLYGFRDDKFKSGLERLGFQIAQQAVTNYCQTELSMSSTLNMRPVQDFKLAGGHATDIRAILDVKVDRSEVSQVFRSLGYRYFAVTTGFPALTFESADQRIEQSSGSTLYMNALLEKTPFRPSASNYASQFAARWRLINGSFRAVENLAEPAAAPKFVVAHILAPHPPFVFDAEGKQIRTSNTFSFVDGSHYVDGGGSLEDYRKGYRNQATYIARRTLETVQKIVATNPKAVILLQGDHGPKSAFHHDLVDRTDLDEVFGILSAYRAPESVQKRLHDAFTPVNSFRVLFSELFSMEYPELPDRSYYSAWMQPLSFTDVTSQLAKPRGASSTAERTEGNSVTLREAKIRLNDESRAGL